MALNVYFNCYKHSDLKKIGRIHREKGLTFSYTDRDGKQYVKIGSGKSKARFWDYWSGHGAVSNHIKSIFPRAYVTSGSWGGDFFEVTFRINPDD